MEFKEEKNEEDQSMLIDNEDDHSTSSESFENEENPSLTENGDQAFLLSDKNLDFFTRITRSANITDYVNAFLESWKENRILAMKNLMNLRDIRNGKGEKLIPVVIVVCLKETLPKETYEIVLKEMVKLGYWKDILKVHEISCFLTKRFDEITPEIELFAEQLKQDHNALISNTSNVAISLCGKWAPTEKTHFDKEPIRAAKLIAKKMGCNMEEYRHCLTALRKHLNVLETLMSTGQYDKIDFSKIPSIAIKKMDTAFKRGTNANGEESEGRTKLKLSYQEFLTKLSKGEVKVNAKGLQPHELVEKYLNGSSELNTLFEGQWKTIVEDLKKTGTFDHVTAISDVSGSMSGTPMVVSIALGLLVAACTKEPFNNRVLTFSESPTWHILKKDTLHDQVKSLSKAKWGNSTDLRKAFNLILEEAVNNEIPPEKMVKVLFIFTDMQFNTADSKSSTFEDVKELFKQKGYDLPKIVFWNLRTSSQKIAPVDDHQKGVVMLSGFSGELLKAVMNDKLDDFTPIKMMLHVLDKYPVIPEVSNCSVTELKLPFELSDLEKAVEKSKLKKAYKKDNKSSHPSRKFQSESDSE
jgi:hypothetical protein